MKSYTVTKGNKEYQYFMRDKAEVNSRSFVHIFIDGKFQKSALIKVEDEELINKKLEEMVK